MNELSILLMGGVISLVVQFGKKYLPKVNPLLYVAVLAVIGGILKAVLAPMLPKEALTLAGASFASAVALYETLKAFIPKSGGSDVF
jgi:purine-cytosine permease-like protein